MKKYILTIVLTYFSMGLLFSQDKMVIEKPFNGNTDYAGYSVHLNSVSELPDIILSNVQGHLNKLLGSMALNTHFSHGQVIDVKNYFKNDPIVHTRGWILPKYDLNFILQDHSIGIKSYYIQLRLDEYGQLLSVNWPRTGYSDKSKFESRHEIERIALMHADLRGFSLADYIVDLKYNQKHVKLCWVFKFPKKSESNNKAFHTIELDWKETDVVDEYTTVISTLH